MALEVEEVVRAFEGVRRAMNDGRYAPHKPLMLLLALARVQQGMPRLMTFPEIEPKLKTLLAEFGPSGSEATRNMPFWYLQSDHQGELWQVARPPALAVQPTNTAPGLTVMRQQNLQAGFTPAIHAALAADPLLLQMVALRVLERFFPSTLHGDICAEIGLSLDASPSTGDAKYAGAPRRRDPHFRERVLRAYEYRCCVCGFDLRVGHMPAGLEAAHIQWHTAGGPDIEPNGLSLCSLHHKLFDLGAFSIAPAEFRVVFSALAIAGDRGLSGVLSQHGKQMLDPQQPSLRPGAEFLRWHWENVFKGPGRELPQ